MRDIKFRAWDKRHNKFLYKFFYDRNWYNKDDKCVRGLMPECQHHQILEEYTGLKDKNGEEIYEGDITEMDYKYYNLQILFKEGSFYGKANCGLLTALSKEYGENCSVIGNIHKNPELLKE